jgi:hypothetical protein
VLGKLLENIMDERPENVSEHIVKYLTQSEPMAAVRAAQGRLSALSVFYRKPVLYGAFVWARRTLNSQN